MIRISLRSPLAASKATEWVSVCTLIGLALVSVAAAFEHMHLGARSLTAPRHTAARGAPRMPAALPDQSRILKPLPDKRPQPLDSVRPAPPPPADVHVPDTNLAPAVQASTPSTRAAARVPARARPGPTTELATKTPELPKITRIVTPARDINFGEADRSVPRVQSASAPAAGTTVLVLARQRDLPLLRDEQAFETWGDEFAKGDARLKEMILAGALTSVQKGAKVRILEVRGALAHVEILGDGRRGWIRSTSLGK